MHFKGTITSKLSNKINEAFACSTFHPSMPNLSLAFKKSFKLLDTLKYFRGVEVVKLLDKKIIMNVMLIKLQIFTVLEHFIIH